MAEIAGRVPAVRVLIFGSILCNPGSAADLDILVVYRDPDDLQDFRNLVDNADALPAIDMTAMSVEEERHSPFRLNSGAIGLSVALTLAQDCHAPGNEQPTRLGHSARPKLGGSS
ncbi:hypothetical protein ACRAWC_09315 [Leifsonia sp. L25]|uniref:hypothetical protein n=1 Tax=Actinomycetes TaxID=1760 RepID=UPI003D6844A4